MQQQFERGAGALWLAVTNGSAASLICLSVGVTDWALGINQNKSRPLFVRRPRASLCRFDHHYHVKYSLSYGAHIHARGRRTRKDFDVARAWYIMEVPSCHAGPPSGHLLCQWFGRRDGQGGKSDYALTSEVKKSTQKYSIMIELLWIN